MSSSTRNDEGPYFDLSSSTRNDEGPTAGPTIIVVLALLSIFVAIMNMMIIDLQSIENGCPENMSSFGRIIELFALIISFFGAYGVAFGAFLSLLTGSTIGSAVNACRR